MRPNGAMTPIPMPGFHQHPSGGAMAVPRPRSGLANFMMPYPLHRQNQHGHWAGFRRGATNMQQQNFQQQQVCNV